MVTITFYVGTCQSRNKIRNLLVGDHVTISKRYTKKVFVRSNLTKVT